MRLMDDKWKFRSPLTTLSALLVDLVQGMPSSIAISFPRGCLPLATVYRPAPRQRTKLGESDDLLVMIGGASLLPFLALGLATVPSQFSAAIVHGGMTAVLPRQAAIQILRGRVHTSSLPQRSLPLPTTRLREHYATRSRRAASLLAHALRTAAQMFA